jgi:lysozyme
VTREQANEAFVRAAQAAKGLKVDGWAGDKTWTAYGLFNGATGAVTDLTERGVLELISHEAIVQEAYKDSVGVWTWAIGVTNASSHEVYPRYKDNPQSLGRCIEASVWLMRTKYLPDVLKAFDGHALNEAQLTAALSFHYNTGAIGRADWVKSWRAGLNEIARAQIMNWKSPPEIVERRAKERDLFFDGKWSGNGTGTVYPVSKPSYSPAWSKAKKVDVTAAVKVALNA